MFNIIIKRPKYKDVDELKKFFELIIVDTFIKEGVGHLKDDIRDEINSKIKYLNEDLESNGKKRYFLVAFLNDKIVGTIEYGKASELINKCTLGKLKAVVEIGTVFVHPNYQRKNIGNILLNSMFITLLSKGIEDFCLDSGYKIAQKIWIKKFGEPNYLLKDYWGKGYDHMIWYKNLNEIEIKFNL